MQPAFSIIECTCGVRYERRERALPIKDIGSFECDECGARVEIWSGRTVPLFRRIIEPKTEARRA